jgi:hypothetical protein
MAVTDDTALPAEDLLPGILDLERLEVDLFRGRSPRDDLQVGPLPDDPLPHVCAAAHAGDMTLPDAVLVAQRLARGQEGLIRVNAGRQG